MIVSGVRIVNLERLNGSMDNISYFGILYLIILVIPILIINKKLKIEINKSIMISIFRMIIQLSIVGIYLKYIFEFNNPFINIAYILITMMIASFSAIKSTNLKKKYVIMPIFISIIIPNSLMILFFNKYVISLENILDARYMITIGGMLLGNVLNGNIVGLNTFYNGIMENQQRYYYELSLGATKIEAIKPYLKAGLQSSIKPTVASMATIGLVALPGMMTGQILGGSVPMEAILYQMAIMIAIFISRYFSTLGALIFSMKFMFDIKDNIITSRFK